MLRSEFHAVWLALMLLSAAGGFARGAEGHVTHKGTFVKAEEGKITVADADKKEHTFELDEHVKIERNEKHAKLGDLQKGDRVTVVVDNNKVAEIEAEGEGNPLLEPRYDLTIWTIVIFVLLLAVLCFVKLPGASAPAWVMMVQGLRKREQSIQQAIDDAKKAREDAEALRAQHRSELDKARDEVRAIIEEGRRNAQQVAEELVSKAKSEVQAERERLRREMDTARTQALRDLTGWAAQLATLISTKALGRQTNADDHRRLVDEALGDMEKTGAQIQQVGSRA